MDSHFIDRGLPSGQANTEKEWDGASPDCGSAMQFLNLVYTPEALRSAARGLHPLGSDEGENCRSA